MMILFYFISIFTGLKVCVLSVSIILFTIFIVIHIISWFDAYFKQDWSKIKIKSMIVSVVFVIFMFIGCFIPTTKDMIIALSFDKILRSEQLSQLDSISQKGLTLIEMKLDEYIQKEMITQEEKTNLKKYSNQ